MTQPSRAASVQKFHAALWYGMPSYRAAWILFPQAVVAVFFAVFFFGAAGGIGPKSGAGDLGGAPGWGQSADIAEAEQEINIVRDAVGDNSDPSGMALIEQLADAGSSLAKFKLGTLYDPSLAGRFPYPAQKDAARALELYQPAYEEGLLEAAMTVVASLRLKRGTPEYDPVIGCEAAKAYMETPQAAGLKGDVTLEHSIMDAADCYAGVFASDGLGPVSASDADVEKAMALYNEPTIATTTYAYYGKAFLSLNGSNKVFDLMKGCDAALKFVDSIGQYTEYYAKDMRWILTEAAYCRLGTDGRRSTAQYQPSIQDEQVALNLLTLPVMEEASLVLGGLMWFHFNTRHELRAPKKGCDYALQWADLTQGDPATYIDLTGWSGTQAALCLLGYRDASTPFKTTDAQRKIAVALLEHFAAQNNSAAQLELGSLLHFGYDQIPVDQTRALGLFQSCAAAGDMDCTVYLADYKRFAYGGLSEDLSGAMAEYEKCAQGGMAVCHAQIVSMQLNQSAPKDLPAVETLAHLTAAMEGGNAMGTSMYAVGLYDGVYGLKSDPAAAAEMFIRAFAMGNSRVTFDHFVEVYVPLAQNAAFWKAFHTELKRRGLYTGKISSRKTVKGLEAAESLVR